MDRPVNPKQKLLHKVIYAAIVVGLVAGIGTMLSQQAANLDGDVTIAELEKNVGQDPYHYIVIDVRTPDEYRAGHIPYALSMPIDQLGRRLGELGGIRERQFAVVCESGDRSSKGAAILRQAGFPSVVDVPEGMAGWRAAGHEVVVDDRAPIHSLMQ